MSILFAVASLVIIYPILIIMPIGLKSKTKFVLLTISLMIAILANLSLTILPVWQSILILIALAALSSIIASKRIGADGEAPVIESLPKMVAVPVVPQLVEQSKVVEDDSTIIISEVEIVENQDTIVEESKEMDELQIDEIEAHLFVAAATEVEFTNEAEKDEENIDGEELEKQAENNESNDYLSEIEKLLAEEESNEAADKLNVKKDIKLEKLF